MHDVIIIGGGHNGLVCAAYLAMAGVKPLVLEQRAIAGGAAVTEEFSPGFSNSTASYAVSLLSPKIMRDLDLAAHGLRIVARPIANFLPLPDGRFLKVGGGQTQREVAKFSARDAARLPEYQARLDAVADVLRDAVLETPPNVIEASPLAAIGEMLKVGRIANKVRRLGLDLQRDLLDLFTASAGDFLDGWFESAPIKAVFGFDGIVGTYASPYATGTAYVLLHHSFGEANARKGAWGHAIGGMGASRAPWRNRPASTAPRSGYRRACAGC
jgi:phytoene dehydrogenase-like protein